MTNCERCPKPGGCRSDPCRFATYQDKTGPRPESPVQRVLRSYYGKPHHRNELPSLTSFRWMQIKQAYGHLCDRANAWDGQPAKRPPAEDVSALYETGPETPSPSPLPPEPDPAGIHGPIRSPGPLSGTVATPAMRGVSDSVPAHGPQIVPATSTRRLSADEVRQVPEPYQALVATNRQGFTPPEPGLLARAIKRVFG